MTFRKKVVVAASLLAMAIGLNVACGWTESVAARRLRVNFECLRAFADALDGIGMQCGGFPVSVDRRALGSTCAEPSELVASMVHTGDLDTVIICDAYERPFLVVGFNEIDVEGIPAECRERYGTTWALDFEVASLGADGVDSGMRARVSIPDEDVETVFRAGRGCTSGWSFTGGTSSMAPVILSWVFGKAADEGCARDK